MTIDIAKLTKMNRGHLCAIINTYGTGQHPFADGTSLQYFKPDYIDEVTKTAWDSNNHTERRTIVNDIRKELGHVEF